MPKKLPEKKVFELKSSNVAHVLYNSRSMMYFMMIIMMFNDLLFVVEERTNVYDCSMTATPNS